jgi:hypothetical protein
MQLALLFCKKPCTTLLISGSVEQGAWRAREAFFSVNNLPVTRQGQLMVTEILPLICQHVSVAVCAGT